MWFADMGCQTNLKSVLRRGGLVAQVPADKMAKVMTEKDLNILVIDEDPERAALLEDALLEGGYTHVVTIQSTKNLRQRVDALAPDLVIVDIANPDAQTLDGVFEVTKLVKKPIAMFVDQSDSDTIRRAMDAGVSAYVVDGLKRDRVRAVVQVALTRFESLERLTQERDDARTALAERKVIDRAKGLLMTQRSISEDDAYKLLRNAAMKQSRKLSDIAESIITAAELGL